MEMLVLAHFAPDEKIEINGKVKSKRLILTHLAGQGTFGINFNIGNISEGWINLDQSVNLFLNANGDDINLNSGTSGNLAIGLASPSEKLDVSGKVKFTRVGSGTNTIALAQNSTGVIVAFSSDRRLKDNITLIPNSLIKISKINGVNYTWKADSTHSLDMGLIAQDVLEVAPEVVYTTPDGYYGINYPNLAGLFVEAIKEQQVIIDSQAQKIDVLESKLIQIQKSQSEMASTVEDLKTFLREITIHDKVETKKK
ncbi:MAG: tail fiber domain-containing protein [Saprospiraceae bacterium]